MALEHRSAWLPAPGTRCFAAPAVLQKAASTNSNTPAASLSAHLLGALAAAVVVLSGVTIAAADPPPSVTAAAGNTATRGSGSKTAELPDIPTPARPRAQDRSSQDGPPNPVLVPSGDEVTRTSDRLVSIREQWQTPGLRLHTVAGYGFFAGGPSVELAHSVDMAVHLGWRFSARWGAYAAFRYAFLLAGLNGVRWSATAEVTYFLAGGLSFTLGVGHGGIWGNVEGDPFYNYEAALEDPDHIDLNQQTGAAVVPPFVACNGDGLVVLARAAYLFETGEHLATGPMVELDGQWTLCSDENFATYIPEDADIKAPQQWWSYFTTGISWVFAWR